MKTFYVALITSVFIYCSSAGQSVTPASNTPVKRRIHFNYITKDSVNLSLNSEFDLIEDSCSEVVRYARVHMPGRKFFGPVKDVSKLEPEVILTEGTYSDDGLKDGYFITHYLNGNLQAKGNFKNNLYDGKWEIYYEDGKPKLTFEAHGKNISVTTAWDSKGTKQVDQGKGNFRTDLGMLYWQGKLLNGKPDGTWRAIKTDDATNTALVTENFKNGLFLKGSDPTGSYKDSSRIVLVPLDYLPFTRAERLHISSVPCNGVKRKHLVRAQYSGGTAAFSEAIKERVSPFLRRFNLKPYNNSLTLNGEVNEYGTITGLIPDNAFDDNLARGIILQLKTLPALQPATADGKPITQKFSITFTFYQGLYRFSYHFLPFSTK